MPAQTANQISLRLKIGLAAIVLLVCIQYGVLPAVTWHADTVERVISLKSAIARKKALIGNEEEINRVYQQSRKKLGQWQALYPAGITDGQELQLSLQKQVESMADKQGIAVSNVDWLPAAADGLSRGAVRFNFETRPEPLMHLLYALETDSRFIAVERIRIHSRGRSKTSFTAELDISAYAIPEALSVE